MNLAELVTTEQDRAFRLALRLTGDADAAADAVQETCVSLLDAGGLDRAESPRAWFLKAVVHTVRRGQRQAQRRRRREEAWAVERRKAPGSPSDELDARGLHEELNRALEALDERLRLPVELHYREGLTHAEIAGVLEMPRGTVGVRIQRGLERLRRRLKEQGSAAAPAILLTGLKDLAMPAAPPKLAARLGRILAGSPAGKGTTGAGAGTSASAVAKGGFTMKLIAGIVLAGAVAGVAAVSMPRDRASGGAPLPAEAPKGGDWRNEQWTVEDFTNVRGGGPTFGPAVQAGGAVYQICGDKDGNLYLANNYTTGAANTIDIVTPDGMRSRLAGTGVRGYRDGPARQAEFDHADRYVSPIGLRADDRGNLFLVDSGNRVIRRIYLKGGEYFVDTWIGGGKRNPSSLKVGESAKPRELALFGAIAAAPDGTVFLKNQWGGYFRVTPDGKSVTFLGGNPKTVAGKTIAADCDRQGNAYFVSQANGQVVSLTADGKIDHMAGLPNDVYKREKTGAGKPRHIGDGPPLTAYIDTPQSFAANPSGACVYTCGGDEYDIRRLPTDGATTTSVLLQNGRWAALKIHPNKNEPREKPCIVNPALEGQPRTEGGKLGNLTNCHIAGRDYEGNLYGFLYPWRGVTLRGPDGQLLRTRLYRVRRVK